MNTDDDKKEAAIQGLHAYRDALHTQMENIKENIHHIEKSIELLSGNDAHTISLAGKACVRTSSSATLTVQNTRYSGLKGQAAVELFLKENPGKWFKASVIAKELLRRGMQKTSKAFTSGITCSLDRAASKGLAIKEKRNGVFKYRSTEEPDATSSTTE